MRAAFTAQYCYSTQQTLHSWPHWTSGHSYVSEGCHKSKHVCHRESKASKMETPVFDLSAASSYSMLLVELTLNMPLISLRAVNPDSGCNMPSSADNIAISICWNTACDGILWNKWPLCERSGLSPSAQMVLLKRPYLVCRDYAEIIDISWGHFKPLNSNVDIPPIYLA